MKVVRANQTESNTETQLLSSTIEIKFDEIPDLTFDKAVAKFDDMIIDMVRKQTGLTFERLSEEIPQTQSVDAKGKKLDAEIVLEMLEKIQVEFYPDGSPHEIHVVGGLFTAERMKAVDDEFRSNPELRRRYEDLVANKREAWRAREANRKLVG